MTIKNDIDFIRKSRIEDFITYNINHNPIKKFRPRAIADYLMIKYLLKIYHHIL